MPTLLDQNAARAFPKHSETQCLGTAILVWQLSMNFSMNFDGFLCPGRTKRLTMTRGTPPSGARKTSGDAVHAAIEGWRPQSLFDKHSGSRCKLLRSFVSCTISCPCPKSVLFPMSSGQMQRKAILIIGVGVRREIDEIGLVLNGSQSLVSWLKDRVWPWSRAGSRRRRPHVLRQGGGAARTRHTPEKSVQCLPQVVTQNVYLALLSLGHSSRSSWSRSKEARSDGHGHPIDDHLVSRQGQSQHSERDCAQ